MSANYQKERLLKLAKSAAYLKYQPAEIAEIYDEICDFFHMDAHLSEIEFFDLNELYFYISLISHHDMQAKACIDRLKDKFNESKSQRIKLLISVYLESQGETEKAMDMLGRDKDEVKLSRRLVTFSRKEGDNRDYIANLVFYLDIQPSDLIAWAELANEYEKAKLFLESIFCLQEILLQEPLDYKIFYRIGLLYYYKVLDETKGATIKALKREKKLEIQKHLVLSRDNFLRSIEICDTYTKSWLGIYILCTMELNKSLKTKSTDTTVSLYLEQAAKLETLSKLKLESQGATEIEDRIKILFKT